MDTSVTAGSRKNKYRATKKRVFSSKLPTTWNVRRTQTRRENEVPTKDREKTGSTRNSQESGHSSDTQQATCWSRLATLRFAERRRVFMSCTRVRVLRPGGALWITVGHSRQVRGSECFVRNFLSTSEVSGPDSRLPVAWCRSGCADLSASSKKSSPSHVAVATWSARFSFPGNAGLWGVHHFARGFRARHCPEVRCLPRAVHCSLEQEAVLGRSDFRPRGVHRSGSAWNFSFLAVTWIAPYGSICFPPPPHDMKHIVMSLAFGLPDTRFPHSVLAQWFLWSSLKHRFFFFLRDEAFFPEWTAWSVMNVPRHVSAICASIFILFQFVIHMMRRVQPFVVVVTTGAHVKTSNRLGSRALVVHRPPSHFHWLCTPALQAVESLCLEMLQMSSKLSVSFPRPSARLAPLLSVAVSCWLPVSAVPSCVDISRTPGRFRTSVNQLSLYGAVADLMKELLVDQRAPGKLVALDQMEQEILTQPPFAEVQADEERQGNLLQDYERRLEKLPEGQKLSNRAPRQVWIWSKLDNSSMVFRSRVEWRIDLHAENTRYLEKEKNLCKRVDRKRCTIRSCLRHRSLQDTRKIQRRS